MSESLRNGDVTIVVESATTSLTPAGVKISVPASLSEVMGVGETYELANYLAGAPDVVGEHLLNGADPNEVARDLRRGAARLDGSAPTHFQAVVRDSAYERAAVGYFDTLEDACAALQDGALLSEAFDDPAPPETLRDPETWEQVGRRHTYVHEGDDGLVEWGVNIHEVPDIEAEKEALAEQELSADEASG